MADASTPVLSTTKYVPPSAYLGEVIQPQVSDLTADVRVPCIIAKGSRLTVARNQPITRAFIQNEALTFSTSSPYLAPLQHQARGDVNVPNVVFTQDGSALRQDDWKYVQVSNQYRQIQVRDEIYNPLDTYFIDYQSADASVRDPLPIPEIRQIRAIGNQLDRDQYREYENYFIPMSFTDVMPDISNIHNTGFLGAITSTPAVGSTGSAVFNTSAQYSFDYTRRYRLTVLSASGSAGSRLVTFKWEALIGSGGSGIAAPIPFHPNDPAPTFQLDETFAPSLTQTLEYGIMLDFDFGGSNFAVGDQFTFNGNGPALVEIDPRYNSPQFASVTAPALVAGTTGDILVNVSPKTNYSNLKNNRFRVKVLSVTGSSPNRVIQFAWVRYGDSPQFSNIFTVQENNFVTHEQPLMDQVFVQFVFTGTSSPSVGATWQMLGRAPRIYYRAKDSRQYKVKIQAATQNISDSLTDITFGYSTDTTEGGFGTSEAVFDWSQSPLNGECLLPDNVSIVFRNAQESYAALDIFTFGIIHGTQIDWTLEANTQDIRELTDYLTDLNGSITGQAGLRYIILSSVPTSEESIRVLDFNTNDPISFNWVIGTQYIFFESDPAVPLRIQYRFKGAEPEVGQIYYMTATALRPDAAYNSPFLALRLDDGRTFSAPSAISNDLYIGNEIAWANGAQAVYLLQPKNLDGSGTYTRPDFQTAIVSVRSYPRITDLCLLNYPSSLEDVLEENLLACDPFAKRPNLVWAGFPIGTPIGDDNTDGSLVFAAKRTLQVAGASSAKGTRVEIGNTRATKQIVLDNGTTVTVTLDGSFLALAAASRVASFNDPATDMLKTPVSGFDSITIYRDEDNNLLGAAQIIYITGAPGSYQWGEDTTVDKDGNFNRVQLMTQRSFVTKVVTREMESLIGITPASGTAGKQLVQGQLASILRGLLARGLIGQYQDKSGNVRDFNPQTDVIVYQDKNDPTLYYFNFAWYSRNVIKRLFGLYSLNSNDFSTGVPLT